jgi:hypothetical protein
MVEMTPHPGRPDAAYSGRGLTTTNRRACLAYWTGGRTGLREKEER